MHREQAVPNRVDPTVHHMESTAIHAGVDDSLADPAIEQLSARHEPMLTLGQPRDQPIDPFLHASSHPPCITSDAFVLP
jgi:hypothetical protein